MEMRLQKILSQSGYGSRRKCEEIIKQGRVRVNGGVAKLGEKADQVKDIITIDGQQISSHSEKKIYIALNKPRGILSEVDLNEPRASVRDIIDEKGHLFCVGRLDKNSEGLMLLTNDGELAHRLTHPRYEHEKEYLVMVGNKPDDQQMGLWRNGGIEIEEGFRTAPAVVEIDSSKGKEVWLRVVLHEGRKRQIRRVGAKIGLPVKQIIRIRIGTLELGELAKGKWRHLTPDEVISLKSYANLKS